MEHVPRRDRVPLRYAADRRSLFVLGALTVLFIVEWSGVARHAGLLAATCVLAFVACVVKHNHVHCSTFTRRRWNAVFGVLLSLLTGHPTTAIITAHNVRHHGHNQSTLDWVRCSVVGFRWNWMNLLAFPFVAVARMRRERASDLRVWRRARPALYRQAVAERVVLYGVMAPLFALDWKATLVCLVGPWLFGQWGIVTINLLQHQGCDPATPWNHSRNVTGRVVNWLLLNNGFHTAHHVWPSVHWSLLPEVHRTSVVPYMRPELEHRSLIAACWHQFVKAPRAAPVGAP